MVPPLKIKEEKCVEIFLHQSNVPKKTNIKGNDDLLIELANKGPVWYRDFIITRPLYIEKHWVLKCCKFTFIPHNLQPSILVPSGVTCCEFDFSHDWQKRR